MPKFSGPPPPNLIPEITDPPPEDIEADLQALRLELDNSDIPRKVLDQNLIVATWNLRAFGNLTQKWKSDASDSPKRDLHSLLCISEIISRFDVVALQEVRGNIKSLRHMLKYLGEDWGLILTDVTKGKEGNDERLAFVFDKRKVNISGLACELVVPPDKLEDIRESALRKQFARTPYAVAFRSKDKTFILVTLHVIYGKRPKQRLPEITAIAKWLHEWALDINVYDQNLIVLGDFNIDRAGDELYNAFIQNGLFIHPELHKVPRTVFSDPSQPSLDKFYDQIAWFIGGGNTPALSLNYSRGGSFDFVDKALRNRNLDLETLTWHISDHYPLWVEFSMREKPASTSLSPSQVRPGDRAEDFSPDSLSTAEGTPTPL